MNAIRNRKIMLGVMSFLSCLAIVVVSSFFPFIFEPDNLFNKKFWTDEIIIIAITLISIISFVFISQASNAQNPKSQIAKANVAFSTSVEGITNHTRFYQWVKKVLQKKDKQEIIERKLNEIGIQDKRVYNLDPKDIEQLFMPCKINDVIYRRLTKEQIEKLLALKKRMGKMKFVNPSYYTSTRTLDAHKTFSEIAIGESKKKALTLLMDVTAKVITTLLVAMVFASFVRDMTTEIDKASATYTFVVRLWTMITSAFVGYRTGSNINDIDAFYIMKRVEVHKLYNEDKSFVFVEEKQDDIQEILKIDEYGNSKKGVMINGKLQDD